jgi:multidrug resistance efflux pump
MEGHNTFKSEHPVQAARNKTYGSKAERKTAIKTAQADPNSARSERIAQKTTRKSAHAANRALNLVYKGGGTSEEKEHAASRLKEANTAYKAARKDNAGNRAYQAKLKAEREDSGGLLSKFKKSMGVTKGTVSKFKKVSTFGKKD